MTLTGTPVPQPSHEQWRELWNGVADQQQTHSDEASNIVIDYLVANDLMLDPEGGDGDPVLVLQGAMEIGFMLGIKAVQDGACSI